VLFQKVGAAFEVLNELGHGFNEKLFEKGLVVEFGRRKIPYGQQKHHDCFMIRVYSCSFVVFSA
jgi:GxxExxY protein